MIPPSIAARLADVPDRVGRKRLALAALAVGATVAGGWLLWPSLLRLVSADAFERMLSRAGPFAPALFVSLQALQVIVAPIPGQLLGSVGGYLFGGLRGTVYSMLGVVLGSLIVFGLARHAGRRLATRLASDAAVERFEDFGAQNGTVTLFVCFLLPTFPDDVLCVVAGLWDVRPRTFVVLLLVGRTPSFYAAAAAGNGIAQGALGRVSLLLTVVGIVSLVVYLARDRLEARLGETDVGNT